MGGAPAPPPPRPPTPPRLCFLPVRMCSPAHIHLKLPAAPAPRHSRALPFPVPRSCPVPLSRPLLRPPDFIEHLLCSEDFCPEGARRGAARTACRPHSARSPTEARDSVHASQQRREVFVQNRRPRASEVLTQGPAVRSRRAEASSALWAPGFPPQPPRELLEGGLPQPPGCFLSGAWSWGGRPFPGIPAD